MGEEIYYKKVVDLSTKEMMMIYDRHQDCQYPMLIPRFDKTGIVMNLANIEPNFLLDLEKKYIFRKIGKDLKYDPDYDSEAVQKTARADHVLNIDKINDLIMLNDLNSVLAKIKEESDEDQTKTQDTTGSSKTGPAPGPAKDDGRETKADPAPGPATDQPRGTTTGSAPESASGPAPGPNFGHAQAPNAKSNTTPRSGPAPTSTASGANLDTTGSQSRMKTPKFDSQLPIHT